MTRTEAYRTLGISSSASNSKVELLYKEKCKELRLQMVPGMPLPTRQKAQTELVKATSAWQTIQVSSPSIPHKTKQKARRKTRSRARQTSHNPIWPQTTSQPVADFVGSIPLPKTVVVFIFILTMLIVVSMLRSCINIRVSASTKAGAKVSSCVNFDKVAAPVTGQSTTNTRAATIDDRPEPLNASTEDTKAQETTKNIQKIQRYQREILIW